jgi:hypothetical protein
MKPTIVFMFMSVIWCGCLDHHATEPPNSSSFSDTLRAKIRDGVFLQLDSMKNTYSLEDLIHGHLFIVNESDSTPYMQRMYGPPAHSFIVFGYNDSMVYFDPMSVGLSEWTITLHIGDSVSGKINWSQNIWSPTTMVSGLKAFSGVYRIEAGFGAGVRVTKWITISEFGNPVSSTINLDYETADSLVFSFVLRNRITRPLEYRLASVPFRISFVKNQDTVRVEYVGGQVPLPIPASSDHMLFTYAKALTDSAFVGFSGYYDIIAQVRFQQTTVAGRTSFWF